MALFGYARTSTKDQNLDLQIDALKKLGCKDKDIYTDQASGSKRDRPELIKVLGLLKQGDCLIVWKLDRLGRSLKHLIDIIQDLEKRHISFQTVQGGIDTTSHTGRLIFHIFGALAEFERELIKERVEAGLEAARKRGRIGGRPRALTSDQIDIARVLIDSGKSQADVAKALKVGTVTIWRALTREGRA